MKERVISGVVIAALIVGAGLRSSNNGVLYDRFSGACPRDIGSGEYRESEYAYWVCTRNDGGLLCRAHCISGEMGGSSGSDGPCI